MSDSAVHDEAREALQGALFEIKRVIIGQDAMLERVMVALLVGGHVLLEGVPGLAKTLTVKTLASVLGGSFKRVQFTPDLVPADLVGTRIYRPDSGRFDVELGPVLCNFLLADDHPLHLVERSLERRAGLLEGVCARRHGRDGHGVGLLVREFVGHADQSDPSPIKSG